MGVSSWHGGAAPYANTSTSGGTESSLRVDYKQTTTNHVAPTSCGVLAKYALSSAAAQAHTQKIPAAPFTIRLTKNCVNIPIVPGSVLFRWGGKTFYDLQGSIFSDKDPNTGVGILRGSIDYMSGIVTLDVYDQGANTLQVLSLAGRLGSQYVTDITFRTPGIPLRTASLTIAGVTMHGKRFQCTANENGILQSEWCDGFVDAQTGLVTVGFGQLIDDSASYQAEDWYNANLVRDGKVWKPEPVYADSLQYACVVYSYIPLDQNLLGINAVRLPVDGRVPIARAGDVAVIHNTQDMPMEQAPNIGLVVTLPRAADDVEIYDSSDPPLRVPKTLYTHQSGTALISIEAAATAFSGYTLPLVVNHRVEEMCLLAATRINGQITLSRALSKSYPAEGTLVSTALPFGDLQARAFNLFDQKTWKNEFSNDISGDPAGGTYNEIDYPIVVLNSGAVNERWALVFDSDQHFSIIAEQRGVVGEGYITQDVQPISEITRKPYFFIDYRGFGSGWAAGNVIRFNTEAATGAIWTVRTTLQGPEGPAYDHYVIQPRGDAQ